MNDSHRSIAPSPQACGSILSRRDSTLLTGGFNRRTRRYTTFGKSRRDDTLLTGGFNRRTRRCTTFRKSRRDDTLLTVDEAKRNLRGHPRLSQVPQGRHITLLTGAGAKCNPRKKRIS
jgi:hypothetical protein